MSAAEASQDRSLYNTAPISKETRAKLRAISANQTIPHRSPKPSTASDPEKLKRVKEARRILEERATFPNPLDIQPE